MSEQKEWDCDCTQTALSTIYERSIEEIVREWRPKAEPLFPDFCCYSYVWGMTKQTHAGDSKVLP